MIRRSFLVCFSLLSLVLLACSHTTLQTKNSILVALGNKRGENWLWRISSDGTFTRRPFDFSRGGRSTSLGTTLPVISPNQQWVAFTLNQDLWLQYVPTEQATRITHVGKPYDDRYASIEVLITAWSPDNRQLLYNVDHGETVCEDCNRTDYQIRPADYGFYLYDLNKKTHFPIKLPGEYEGWSPNGEIMITLWDREDGVQRLLGIKPGEAIARQITPIRGWYGQLDFSSDGRWALARFGLRHGYDGTNDSSQIVKIELDTGAMTSASPKGLYAEFQSPLFSPSALHISYVQGNTVMMDGQPMYECEGGIGHSWINDRTLLLLCRGKLIILDIQTHQKKVIPIED